MILALDISTKIVGYAIIDSSNGDIITYGAWRFTSKKYKNIFDKARVLKQNLIEAGKDHAITHIFIEEIAKKFSSGKSSAQTIAILAQFNGIGSYLCSEVFSPLLPAYIPPSTARRLAGIKVPRGQKAKQVVVNYLLDNVPVYEVEYTRAGNVGPAYYDMADAIVLGLAGYSKLCGKK